jgi:hypothetical protein
VHYGRSDAGTTACLSLTADARASATDFVRQLDASLEAVRSASHYQEVCARRRSDPPEQNTYQVNDLVLEPAQGPATTSVKAATAHDRPL